MSVRVLRAAVVGAVLVVSGCSWADDGGRDYNPDHQPGYVLPEPVVSEPAVRLPGAREAVPGRPDHVVRGGDGYAVRPSVFQLVDGADVVRVSVADLGGPLFHVSTPGDSKVVPAVDLDGNTVVAGLRESGLGGPALVTVLLARDVRWQVRLSGGAGDEGVDLTGSPAGGDVELIGGTSRAEVSLPAAGGTQRVSMSGGAGRMVVRLGGAAPVRVSVGQGAGTVTVDGQRRAGIAGGSVFAPLGWEGAADRYAVDAAGGVSELTVTRD